jgi:hypothetical protein
MSQATLLVDPVGPGQAETFAFEHAMAHRTLLGGMASPVEVYTPVIPTPPPPPPLPQPFILPGTTGLSGFSAIPYGPLDPSTNVAPWLLDHGQAHNDFGETLPGWFGFRSLRSLRQQVLTQDTEQVQALNPAQPMVDFNLQDSGQRAWWTFANHQEHLTATNTLPEQLIYPFW